MLRRSKKTCKCHTRSNLAFRDHQRKDIIYKRASAMQEVQMNCKFMTDVHGKNETFLQELHENWSRNFTTLFKCIENKLGWHTYQLLILVLDNIAEINLQVDVTPTTRSSIEGITKWKSTLRVISIVIYLQMAVNSFSSVWCGSGACIDNAVLKVVQKVLIVDKISLKSTTTERYTK